MRLGPVLSWVGLLALAGTPGAASGQTTSQVPLEFDFLNPGARSLSMGSAFVGAADDATTAFANPAGLGFLSSIEVSAELRVRSTEQPFLAGGRLSGQVTGRGLDTVAGAVYGEDVDRQATPAFLSVVVPLSRIGTPQQDASGRDVRRRRDPFTLTAYRQQVARLENSFNSQGPFERSSFAGEISDASRQLPQSGTRKVDIASYGAAVGYQLTRQIAFGGALTLNTFDLDSGFASYGLESDVFSPPDPANVLSTADQAGDDLAFSYQAGFNWRTSPDFTRSVKVGAVYRRGPRFEFEQVDRVIPANIVLVRPGRFKVPDVIAAGVEWRLIDSVRLVGDYDFVRYSQLKEDFITIQAIASGRQAQLQIDDGHEVHAGGEYLVPKGPLVAVRGGFWIDPDHAVRYEPTPAGDTLDVRLSAALRGSKTVTHVTAGGTIMIQKLEVNVGVDWSSRTNYFTTSAVWRF